MKEKHTKENANKRNHGLTRNEDFKIGSKAYLYIIFKDSWGRFVFWIFHVPVKIPTEATIIVLDLKISPDRTNGILLAGLLSMFSDWNLCLLACGPQVTAQRWLYGKSEESYFWLTLTTKFAFKCGNIKLSTVSFGKKTKIVKTLWQLPWKPFYFSSIVIFFVFFPLCP